MARYYVKEKIHKTKSILLHSDYDTPSQYIKKFKKIKETLFLHGFETQSACPGSPGSLGLAWLPCNLWCHR